MTVNRRNKRSETLRPFIFCHLPSFSIVFLYDTPNTIVKSVLCHLHDALATNVKGDRTMNTNEKESKKMSVRLDYESVTILKTAVKAGVTQTNYINQAIHASNPSKQTAKRSVQPHLARMQSLLEFCEDTELKNEMREELHQICLYLKS